MIDEEGKMNEAMLKAKRRWLWAIILLSAAFVILVAISLFGGQGIPPEALGRMKATKAVTEGVDEQCQYVSTPWGSATCEIKPDDCAVTFVPMFFGEGRTVTYRLDTNASMDEGSEKTIDFATLGAPNVTLKPDWPAPLKWVEW